MEASQTEETLMRNPLLIIDELFRQKSEHDHSESQIGEREYLGNLIQQIPGFREAIPFISKESFGKLAPGHLIRYRGLIQNIFNTEFFCGLQISPEPSSNYIIGKYRDCLPADIVNDDDHDFENQVIMERQPILCAPIPGEQSWYESSASPMEPDEKPIVTRANKRQSSEVNRDEDGNVDIRSMGNGNGFAGDDESLDEMEGLGPNDTQANRNTRTKLQSPSSGASALLERSNDVRLNDVRPNGVSCLVKMYDGQFQSLGLRLNDMIEVIGIYSFDPAIDAAPTFGDQSAGAGGNLEDLFEDEGELLNAFDGDGDAEVAAQEDAYPPASLAPRLHCLSVRKLPPSYPLLDPTPLPIRDIAAADIPNHGNGNGDGDDDGIGRCNDDGGGEKSGSLCALAEQGGSSTPAWHGEMGGDAEKEVMQRPIPPLSAGSRGVEEVELAVAQLLASAAGGDELVGRYLSLSLLSRPHPLGHGGEDGDRGVGVGGRVRGSLVGHCALNVCGLRVGDERIAAISLAIKQLVPRCVCIDASVAALNQQQLMPERGPSGCLRPSALQMGPGSVLLLDETAMGEGELTPCGARSLRALRGVACAQTLPMDVPYGELEIPTEVVVIVFSHKPSLLLRDCQDCVRVRVVGPGDDAPEGAKRETVVVTTTKTKTRASFPPSPVSVREAETFSLRMAVDKQKATAAAVEMAGAETPSSSAPGRDISSSSFLPASPSPSPFPAERAVVPIEEMRLWWARARLLHVSMQSETISLAENDFVTARQRANQQSQSPTPSGSRVRVSAEEFHRWLTLARLVALSRGSCEIAPCHWEAMRRLEEQRVARLPL